MLIFYGGTQKNNIIIATPTRNPRRNGGTQRYMPSILWETLLIKTIQHNSNYKQTEKC